MVGILGVATREEGKMLKTLTCALLALACCAQTPCMAGDTLGKQLLNEAINTGKGEANKGLDKAANKLTGHSAAAAKTAASAADKAGVTATAAGNSTAATAAKATDKAKTLSKENQGFWKSTGKRLGDKYKKEGQ